LSSRNLEQQNAVCNNANRSSDLSSARKRQRQYSATPTSDDSASEDHSPRKGELVSVYHYAENCSVKDNNNI
jgi:hypothetical protein